MDDMPTEPPFPREERPGVWVTRWRSDETTAGRRPQYNQRFYGSRTDVTREYKRWLKRWRLDGLLQDPTATTGITIAEFAQTYLDHAQRYYRKHGRATSHIWKVRSALQNLVDAVGDSRSSCVTSRILRDLKRQGLVSVNGELFADALTPPLLANLRDELDQPDAKRKTINDWITIIRQAWSWGAQKGLIDSDVALRLSTVSMLTKGRSSSAEYAVVKPIHWSVVEATLEQCTSIVQAMIKLQWHTGMRPGEVCVLRPADVETKGDVWLYCPTEHKGEHIDRRRVVALGPVTQKILTPFLQRDLTGFCFEPVASSIERGRTPRQTIGKRYTTGSYRRAIHRACDRAFPPEGAIAQSEDESAQKWRARLGDAWSQVQEWRAEHQWSPHQLRHAKEAQIERAEGLDAARLFLGHSRQSTTEQYGRSERERRDLERLIELARKYG